MEKLKILAIDDNAVNLASIEQALQDEYEVVSMLNGRRALRYLGVSTADLILLDIQMPEMDGIQTLREIRKLENGASVPVIFLTALEEKDRAESMEQEVVDCIRKPFERDDLKRRIAAALGGLPDSRLS